MRPPDEIRILLAPRRAYAQLAATPLSYIPYYVLFLSLLIGACASYSATQRVTLSLLVSLSVSWMFVPLLHVLVGGALVAWAKGPRLRGNRAIALLLMGHAPWSLWLLIASAGTGTFGFDAYFWMLLLALVPIALTMRIVHAFCVEVLGAGGRRAIRLTLAHQAVTYFIAAMYLDRAVSLVPRIIGWLS